MRIGFNARLLAAPSTRGWNRYAINLLMALVQRDIDLVLYSDRPLDDAHRSRLPDTVTVRVSSGLRYILWEQGWLPSACARDGIQVFHSPFHFGLPLRGPFGRVITVHDAIGTADREPRRPPRPRELPTALSTWLARRRANLVIAPSEHARQEIVRSFHIPDTRIRVIPEAADQRFATPPSEDAQDDVRARFDLTHP